MLPSSRRLLAALGLLPALGAGWLLWRALSPPTAAERLAGDDPALRLGREKLRSFCLSCHQLDGPPEVNPLAPKVRGWTRDEAYVNVGRLGQLNSAMILEFHGTDEERRALALVLERLGSVR